MLRAPTDQLRINHYKHPDMGVFVGGWRSGGAQGSILGQDKIIQDSTMKDRFHDVLLDTNSSSKDHLLNDPSNISLPIVESLN